MGFGLACALPSTPALKKIAFALLGKPWARNSRGLKYSRLVHERALVVC